MNLEKIKSKIITVQGQQVILDSDIANLYNVETKRINEAVKNNPDKFPERYIVELTGEEWNRMLISQVISLTFNSVSSRICVHKNTASCILSTSKYFQCLKTTCPICPQRHGENHAPKSAVFVKNIQPKESFSFSIFN